MAGLQAFVQERRQWRKVHMAMDTATFDIRRKGMACRSVKEPRPVPRDVSSVCQIARFSTS